MIFNAWKYMVFRDKNEFLTLLSKYRSQKQKTQKRVKNKDCGGKIPWFYCSFDFFSRQKEKESDQPKETNQSDLLFSILLLQKKLAASFFGKKQRPWW